LLFLSPMVAYPFPSAATEALVDCSTERLRRLSPISTPKERLINSRLHEERCF